MAKKAPKNGAKKPPKWAYFRPILAPKMGVETGVNTPFRHVEDMSHFWPKMTKKWPKLTKKPQKPRLTLISIFPKK